MRWKRREREILVEGTLGKVEEGRAMKSKRILGWESWEVGRGQNRKHMREQ